MRRSLLSLPALLLLALPLSGQTLQEEMVTDLSAVAEKFISLAEAMPAETYSWRPAEGVRSVGEVFMHISLANIGLPANLVGAGMPDGVDPEWQSQGEQYADKEGIVQALRVSFHHLLQVIEGMSDEDLMTATNVFGRDTNYIGGLMLLQTHSHEHLGQAIAYARSNGVTPPWSR